MIFGRVISCHHFFPLGDIDLICGIWVHSDQLQIKFTFRSGPMIFGILQTWHTHLWHQHISDMTLTFVYFTWHLYWWHQCFSDMTATFMTPMFFRNNSNIYDISVFQTWHLHWWHQWFFFKTWHIYLWHQCIFHMTSTFMTSGVFQTCEQHLWHQCYSDMTFTFMTSVGFF